MNDVIQKIYDIGIVPVIAIDDADKAVPLATALVKGGLPAAEVTFRTAAAEEAIKRIVAEVPEMLVGAGTVLTKEQADRAIAAGVKFIVSPGFNPEITKYVIDKGMLMMPGTATPGEMEQAMSMGLDAAYVTKLPAHAIGQAAVNSLRRYGVDTSKITRGGDRVGIYFNEKGASQRPSVCIYDRAHSAISEATTADFDWDAIFEGVEWFHFTGITPALGANVVEICKEACKAAKAHGVKISCDLNYRGKLWTRDEARAAMTELCQYVDVCISNEEDAKDVFGIEAENTDITGGELNKEGYKSVAKQLADKFNFEMVAITLRESKSAFDNDWSAMLYNVAKDEYCFSKLYHLHIIDRIGGGDSFGGGLIYALLSGKDTQAAVEFAVAASALKHSIEGDYNFVTVPEVEKLAGGDGSGRVQR